MNNDLKLIENELVSVYETDKGEKVVYGTELHTILGVKTSYKDWSERRFVDIDADEKEDYEVLLKEVDLKKTISSNLTPPKKWQCLSATKKASRYADISYR